MTARIDVFDRILTEGTFELDTKTLGRVRCRPIARIIDDGVFREQIRAKSLDGPTLVRNLLARVASRTEGEASQRDGRATSELLSDADINRLTQTEIELFSQQIYSHNKWLCETDKRSNADSATKTKIPAFPTSTAKGHSDHLLRVLRIRLTEWDKRERLFHRLQETLPHLQTAGASLSRLQKDFQRFAKSSDHFRDFDAQIKDALAPLRKINQDFNFDKFASKRVAELVQANQHWQNVLVHATAQSRLLAEAARVHPTWTRDIKFATNWTAAVDAAARLALGTLSYRLTISERLFARLDVSAFTRSSILSEEAMRGLWVLRNDLTTGYRRLAESVETCEQIVQWPKFVLPSATREVIVANQAIEELIDREEAESSRDAAERELMEGSVDEISNCTALLTDVDPPLARMYEGARRALHDGNPDGHRHILTSLRELVNHLLRTMAPDGSVIAWIPEQSEDWLHKGRPTRKARFRYLCREISSGPMDDFVVADTKAIVTFLELLNRVHQPEIKLTSRQLQAILHRTASFVTFIVPIWKESSK